MTSSLPTSNPAFSGKSFLTKPNSPQAMHNSSQEFQSNNAKYHATIIFGPTAVGKTALLSLFKDLAIEVISADSRQIYKGFNIVSAYPPKDILESIPHHLIDSKHFSETYTVYDFVKDASSLVKEIHKRGKYPLIVGGCAFYLYNLWKGLPNTPEIDNDIRKSLKTKHATQGQEALYSELQKVDSVYAEKIPSRDVYRTLRALEVYHQTGKPLSSYTQNNSFISHMDFSILGLYRERKLLYTRIDERVEEMYHNGLVDEVHDLWKSGLSMEHSAAHTIGIQELLGDSEIISAWEKGRGISQELLEDKINDIKTHSRRYAKRQHTFFKKFEGIKWYDLEQQSMLEIIHSDIMQLMSRYKD